MVFLAATATPSGGYSALVVLVMIVVTVGYMLFCWIWPFRPCRHCRGYGRFKGPFRGIRLCRRCDGTGMKLRAGRRMWNSGRRAYREVKPRSTRRR